MDQHQSAGDVFDQCALWYQEKFMDMELYNDTYDLFCTFLGEPSPSILEIGCGPGNITRYLLAKRPDCRITATDIAPNMVQLAQENNPAAECLVMDCREIAGLRHTYDAVVVGFCLPYLPADDTAALIRDCAGLLAGQGVLYLSTIEGDYSLSGFEWNSKGTAGTHVYYYTEQQLAELLQKAGFDILAVERKSYARSEDMTSTHLVIIARKIGSVR